MRSAIFGVQRSRVVLTPLLWVKLAKLSVLVFSGVVSPVFGFLLVQTFYVPNPPHSPAQNEVFGFQQSGLTCVWFFISSKLFYVPNPPHSPAWNEVVLFVRGCFSLS